MHHPYSARIPTFTINTLVKPLTCCGLQEKQGEETADQDCTLHDGCQENSDCPTDYIYQGRKVKGHAERGGGAGRGQLVEGLGCLCSMCCRSLSVPQQHYACWQLALLWNEAVGQRWSPSGLQNPDLSTDASSYSPFIIWLNRFQKLGECNTPVWSIALKLANDISTNTLQYL